MAASHTFGCTTIAARVGAVAAWAGGVALATVVLIAVVVLLVLRARRHRHDPPSPFIARGRS